MDEQEVRYSFTGDFRDLASVTERVMSLLDSVSAKFKQTDSSSTFKKTQTAAKDVQRAFKDLGTEFSGVAKSAKSVSSSFSMLTSAGNTLKKVLAGLTGIKIGSWFADATKESIEYIENLNLFTVAMGKSVDQGLQFVNTMAELYGLDPSNLYRYSGYFYQLTDAIGMTDEASANLSLSMTKAANDIASLFNMPIETVVNNLASGMQGMSRSVRKYGMDIRAVTLQQTALSYGLTEQVETMSEADRMALRYLTMMEQVKNATQQVVNETSASSGVIGDFARNIETPANQLRVLKEQISQLGRAIGNVLLPAFSAILPIVNGVIMALRAVISLLAPLVGFTTAFGGASSGAEDTAKSFKNVGGAASGASKAVKELRKTLAPFDEINPLQAPNEGSEGGGGSGGGATSDLLDPKLAEALKNMQLNMDKIRMKAADVRDAILKFFGFEEVDGKLQWFADRFKQNLIDKFPGWGSTIEALFSNWTSIVDFVKTLHLDATFAKGINNLSGGLQGLARWISKNKDQIASLVLSILAVVEAFKAFKTVESFLKPIYTLGSKIVPIVTGFVQLAAPLLAVAALFALLWTSSERFRTAIQSLLEVVISIASTIWSTLVPVFQSLMAMLQEIWSSAIQPVLTALGDLVGAVIEILVQLWQEVVGPLFEHVMSTLPELFNKVIRPIIENVLKLLGSIIIMIMSLWTETLQPVVSWIVSTLGPTIANAFKAIWSIVSTVLSSISGLIQGLLQILQGIITFLTGVFTGDWSKAWEGIVQIFKGIVNTIISAFETGINAIISLVNTVITVVWSAVQGFVNGILSTVNSISSLLGFSINLNWGTPPPLASPVSIPKLATGGVVSSPTYAMIGEGHYDEAVVPLGNSPQMRDFADSVASRSGSTEQVSLLREQNQLLRQILEKSGDAIGIKDLTAHVTKIQRQIARVGGY